MGHVIGQFVLAILESLAELFCFFTGKMVVASDHRRTGRPDAANNSTKLESLAIQTTADRADRR
jgi:hypothetical protein